MKENTRLRLEEELRNGKYLYNYDILNSPDFLEFFEGNGTLRRLFEIYLEEEIDDVDTFFKIFTNKSGREIDFYHFIMSHIDDFQISKKYLEEVDTTPEEVLSHDAIMASKKVIGALPKGYVRNKQKFVNIAKSIIRSGRMLEVGSGTDIPVSSMLFAKELGEISSMDKFHNHWSCLDFFKKLKINAIDGFFTNDTDIKNYDVIVGQHPCDAIIPIVEKLGNSDEKEYFIEMCDCASPSGGMSGFLMYLKNKDKRLQSVLVKNNHLTKQYEYYLNSLPFMSYSDTLYITNAAMHPDDILAKVVEENVK